MQNGFSQDGPGDKGSGDKYACDHATKLQSIKKSGIGGNLK